MRVQWKNILEDADTLTATNEDPNFPVSNLIMNTHRIPFKATANNSVVTASYSADQAISCLVVGEQNINSMTVTAKDAADATLWTAVYSGTDFRWTSSTGMVYNSNVLYFTQVQGVRTLEFSILAFSNVDIGGIMAGVYLQFTNVVTRPDLSLVHTGKGEKTRGGVLFEVDGETLERFKAAIGIMEILDWDTLHDFQDLCGPGRTVFLDRFEDIDTIRPFLANLRSAKFEGLKQPGVPPVQIRNVELDFEECH